MRIARPSWPFVVAWVLFVVSFFPVAFEHLHGWRCAIISAAILWSIISENFSWDSLYYALFTLPNAFMLLSPFVVFRKKAKSRRFFFVVAVLLTASVLYVMSFSIVAGKSNRLQIGYFLWTASFIVFCGEWLRVGTGSHFQNPALPADRL